MNQELKNLISALIDSGKAIELVIKDKGLNAEQMPIAQQLFMEIPMGVSGAPKALEQLKSITPEGEVDLVAFIMQKLGITDQKTATIIVKGFAFGFAGYQLEQAIAAK